jgi:tetratricopeptide (TPR) repeat protein
MRSRWPLLFVLMHIAGFSGAATALTLDQQRCSAAPDLDLIISGCTEVIQSGHETLQNLATAFNNRGVAYASKRQLDRAIQDFDQAIRINPNDALAFGNRGNYYAVTRQYDRAIQDYDQAIRINPNFADAFYNRGRAYAHKRQYDRAIQDFDQAIRIKPNYAEALHNRRLAKRAKSATTLRGKKP